MFVENKQIEVPDPSTIVWKYLDLSKFLDLLLSRKMFMARSDKFEDKFEGTFSEPTFEELKRISGDKPGFLDHYKDRRKNVVISSWHINEYESYAMWQIFTKNNEASPYKAPSAAFRKRLHLNHGTVSTLAVLITLTTKKNTSRLTTTSSLFFLSEKASSMKGKYVSLPTCRIADLQ